MGYSDITLIDEGQVCAAAQSYAAKNGGRLTECDVDTLQVTVSGYGPAVFEITLVSVDD